MGYLPAVIVGVAGLLVVVALVVVLSGHLRRTTRAAGALRSGLASQAGTLRSGAASLRERRVGRN